MKNRMSRRLGLLMWLGVAVCFAGCRSATPPVQFFTLSALSEASPQILKEFGETSVGMGPVALPQYLNRPQIVTRSGPNQVKMSEFNQWAGFLDQDITNILTENLSALLNSHQVVAFPWSETIRPDYRVLLDVTRFEGTPGKSVHLNVAWVIKDKEQQVLEKSMITMPVSGTTYDDLVAAQSRALAELSRQIAGKLMGMASGQ